MTFQPLSTDKATFLQKVESSNKFRYDTIKGRIAETLIQELDSLAIDNQSDTVVVGSFWEL
jgi:hypothetical protein